VFSDKPVRIGGEGRSPKERFAMKNSLWITAAAAALLATSYAAAQNMPKAGQDAPAATQSRPAGQGAGNTGGINAPNAATEDSEHPTKKGVKGASDESQPPRKGQKIGQERPAKGGAQTTQDRRQGAGTETRTDRDRQGDRRETTGARPSGGQVNVQISTIGKTFFRFNLETDLDISVFDFHGADKSGQGTHGLFANRGRRSRSIQLKQCCPHRRRQDSWQ